MKAFLSRHKRTILALTTAFFYSVAITYATPPASQYNPAETLDPTCAPGDTNCSVSLYPDQTGNTGEFLTTDGTTVSWATIPASTNIYNTDGTLTANRTLTLSGNSLDIAGSTTTRFFANGNVAIGTTTDDGYKLRVQGNARVQGQLTAVQSSGMVGGVSQSDFITTAFAGLPSTFQVNHNGANYGLSIARADNSGSAPHFTFYKTRGGGVHSTKGALVNGDQLANINFFAVAQDGVSTPIAALIQVFSYAQGGISYVGGGAVPPTTSVPTLFQFSTTGMDGVRRRRLDIMPDGEIVLSNVGFRNWNNYYKLQVDGSASIHGSFVVNTFATATADPSAIAEFSSTTKGALLPRMTNAERGAITTPATGLLAYSTDATEGLYVNLSGGWQRFLTTADSASFSNIYTADGSLTGARTLTLNSNPLDIAGTSTTRFFANGNVGIGTTTDAGYKLDVNGTSRLSGELTLGAGITYTTSDFRIQDGAFERLRLQGGITTLNNTTSKISLQSVGIGNSMINLEAVNSAGSTAADVSFAKVNSFYSGNIGTTGRIHSVLEVTATGSGAGGGAPALRYLYINPATTGFAFERAIETVTGNVVFGSTSGNVLVGTTTDAGYKLDVNGTSRFQGVGRFTAGANNYIDVVANSNGSNPYIEFLHSGVYTYRIASSSSIAGEIISSSNGFILSDPSSNILSLQAHNGVFNNNIETRGGNIYLSSSTGRNGLTFVHSGTSYRGVIGFDTASNYFQIRTGSATSFSDGTLSAAFFNSGNVGIGTTTDAGYKLDVNGVTRTNGLFMPFGSSITMKSQFNNADIVLNTNTDSFSIGLGGGIYGGENGMRYQPIVGAIQGFAITAPGSGSIASATFHALNNNVDFGGTYNIGGNATKPVRFSYTALNQWQIYPINPTAYTAGVQVTISGGNSGDWSNGDNQGVAGALILKAGDAQATGTNTNTSAASMSLYGGRGTGTGTGGDIIFSTSTALGSGTTLQSLSERMRIKYDTGNVLVGSASDGGQKFQVTGTVALSSLTVASSSQDALCIVNAGTEVQRNNGAQTCTVSSARFKHDIEPLSGDILGTLTKFTPSTFIYNDQTNTRIGLIAEDVATIDPRLVFYEADGTTPRGVRYEDLSILTLQGVKDISVTLTTLTDLTIPNTLRTTLTAWLGDVGNGIGKIVSDVFEGKTVKATEKLCVGNTCVTEAQLQQLLQQSGQTNTTAASVETQTIDPVIEEPQEEVSLIEESVIAPVEYQSVPIVDATPVL